MDPSLRFDDDQVRRILARAADRQEQAERALPGAAGGGRTGREPGLSLAQIQEVAGEVGIDAAHVQAAARELQLRDEAPPSTYPFLGIPRETRDQRVVPGVPDDREWERIVAATREEFRVPGVVNDFGDVREWWSSGVAGGGGIQLRLAPGEDGTEITLRRSNQNLSVTTHTLGWTWAGLAGGLGALGAFGSFDPGFVALPVTMGTIAALSFLGGRILSRRSARKSAARFTRLLDRIELIARGGGPP